MMNGDEGGQLSDLIGGDTILMRGDIRLIGGDPPSPPPPLGKTLQLYSVKFCFTEERFNRLNQLHLHPEFDNFKVACSFQQRVQCTTK